MNDRVLKIAAVILRNPEGRVLSVRKRGTTAFMMPGGKVEPHEQPCHTAVREVGEELGLALDATSLTHMGSFSAPAANEAGFRVDCEVFISSSPLEELPEVYEEIEEARWFDPDSVAEELAPLSRDVVFPLL